MRTKTRKQELIEAGIQLFAEQGYHRTTVSDIVQRADVAQGTFYHHFESKKAFFLSLIQEFFELIEEALVAADLNTREAQTVADIAYQIHDVIARILRVYKQNATLARIFLREAVGLDPDFADAWETFTQHLAVVAELALADAIERGLLPEQNSQVISYCIVGMVERVAYHWLSQDTTVNIDDIASAVARFELLGIAGRASPQIEQTLNGKRTQKA